MDLLLANLHSAFVRVLELSKEALYCKNDVNKWLSGSTSSSTAQHSSTFSGPQSLMTGEHIGGEWWCVCCPNIADLEF